MALNGCGHRRCREVVEVESPSAQSPQRSSSNLIVSLWPTVLDNGIISSDIVQQVITVRMDDLVAKRRCDGKATVEHRSRRCSGNGWSVASSTADTAENLLAR